MYLPDAYLAQLQALLPTGPAWTREPDSVLTRLLLAEAAEFARIDERIDQFADETDPRTAYELLADWERVLGLPDPCTAAATTIAARQAACWRKLAYQAGQTPAFYIALAASIGFEIEIHEFDPDVDDWDGSLTGLIGGGRYRYVWRVHVLNAGSLDYFRAGDPVGMRLVEGDVGIDVECILQSARPAHTYIVFSYPEDGLPEPAGPPIVEDVAGGSIASDTPHDFDLSSHISGGGHTSIAAGDGAHGTTHEAGDVVTYTPEAGYSGTDSFTWAATGPGGTSAPATVSLTVAVPAAPSIEDVAVNVPMNAATPIDLSDHVDGVHSSIATSAPSHGARAVSGDVVTYTPTTGYSGSDSVTWTATGPGGTSSTKTITITVAAALFADDVYDYGAVWNTPTSIDLSSSIAGVHTGVSVLGGPSHGSVTVAGDVVTYTPSGGDLGPDSFGYRANASGGGHSNTATVGISVTRFAGGELED